VAGFFLLVEHWIGDVLAGHVIGALSLGIAPILIEAGFPIRPRSMKRAQHTLSP
jgi:membrane-associated phospholipid phosphatase